MHLIGHLKAALSGLNTAWIMWLLSGLSLLSFALIGERLLFFHSLRDDLIALSARLEKSLRSGEYAAALDLLKASPSAEAAVAAAGLAYADMGPAAAEKAMAGALALQRMRLERGVIFLATLGNNAPFVGLLGTVIGVIEAFEVLGNTGAAPDAIMTGISEALVATALGLFVAIPAVATYNYFQRRIQATLANTEALTNIVLAHFYAEAPEPGAT